MGDLSRCLNIFLRTVAVISDILLDSAHKDRRLLTDQPVLLPQWVEFELFDISAIQQNLTRRWLIEPQKQLNNRWFATTRMSDECNFPFLYLEGKILKNNLLPLRVFKRNISKLNRSIEFLLMRASILSTEFLLIFRLNNIKNASISNLRLCHVRH